MIAGDTSSVAYAYDDRDRLTAVISNGVTTESHEYDHNGNRTRITTQAGVALAHYDARDRLTKFGTSSYGYTDDGFLAARVSGQDSTAYKFDELGGLRGVTRVGQQSVAYILDATGRRIGRKLNGGLDKGWVYGGELTIVAQTDSAQRVEARFVYGETQHVPSYMLKGGRTYRFVLDQVGSVRLVIDVEDGTVAQRIDYDAFGRVLRNTNPGFQPFAFAGGLLDEVTGLTHLGVRDYDGETGRWIAKDPMLFAGEDANLYAYVGNDPVNSTDPSGTVAEELPATMAVGESVVAAEASTALVDLAVQRQIELELACYAARAIQGEVHHMVFKVFGGGDVDENYIRLPNNVHSALHRMVNGMLKKTSVNKITNFGKANWDRAFKESAGTRAEVKEVLLTAAKLFDTYCSFIGFKSKFGVPRPSMFDAMKAFMDKPNSGW